LLDTLLGCGIGLLKGSRRYNCCFLGGGGDALGAAIDGLAGAEARVVM